MSEEKQEVPFQIETISNEEWKPGFLVKAKYSGLSIAGIVRDRFGNPLRLLVQVRLLSPCHDDYGPTDEEWGEGHSPCSYDGPSPRVRGYRRAGDDLWQVLLNIGSDLVWVDTRAIASYGQTVF